MGLEGMLPMIGAVAETAVAFRVLNITEKLATGSRSTRRRSPVKARKASGSKKRKTVKKGKKRR
jgi:hypothetical protein